jgi:hypothetical protein
MFTHSCFSRRLRGQSPKFDPFLEIGRKKEIVENFQSKLIRSFFNSSLEITCIYVSFPPWKLTMTSFDDGSGSSSGSTSSQGSTSYLIGSIYNHYNLVVSTTN